LGSSGSGFFPRPVDKAFAPMADQTDKVPENVPGRFYVDRTCIDCELCHTTAPENFIRQDSAGYSYVFRQPRNPAEEAACLAALEECPVEAIGLDGGDAGD
jgi:ferredoxin